MNTSKFIFNNISMGTIALIVVCFSTSTFCATIRIPDQQPNIQAGIDAAKNNDVVLISPGIYYENLVLHDKKIILSSWYYTTALEDYIGQTLIDGGGNSVINVGANSDDTIIMGITIQNGNNGIITSSDIKILNNYIVGNVDGVDYQSGGGGICNDNTIEENLDDGIDLDGPSAVSIIHNTIRNNFDDGVEIRLHEYYGPTLTITIQENIISGNQEDGIQLIDYPDVSDRIFRIERNVFTNNVMAALGLMANGNTIEDYSSAPIPERVYLINNTFINNNYCVTGGANLIALNNIFENTLNIGLKKVGNNSIASYNLFWNNRIDYEQSTVDIETTVFANPLINHDYTLMEGSPAINSGTNSFIWLGETLLNIPKTDYSGSKPDIGAFEYENEFGGTSQYTDSGGCFIATAVYGSQNHKHVQILREFRDNFLIFSQPGRIFIKLYYIYSPMITNFLSNHSHINNFVRWSLLPIICIIWFFLKIGYPITLCIINLLIIGIFGLIIRRNYNGQENGHIIKQQSDNFRQIL